nr:MAG TPA: hypothetical protein [Caudoviricetes sp.]
MRVISRYWLSSFLNGNNFLCLLFCNMNCF